MPFDASRAQKNLQAAARADAHAPDQEAATAAAAPVSAPASTPAVPEPASRRFQRPTETAAPTAAPPADARRFQRSAHEAQSPAAAPAPAGARGFQRQSAPAPAAPSSGRSFAPPAPAPSPAPAARHHGAEQAQAQAQSMVMETVPAKGYGNRVGPARQTSRLGLSPRLELYIDELAFNRGWSKDEVEKRKNEAVQKPQEAEAAYRQMFERIRMQRQQAVASINQGMQDHPGQVVFLTRRSDNEPGKFSALSPEEAGDLRILHGSVFHSMPASATLFADPATVFASKAQAAVTPEDNSDLDDDDLPLIDEAPVATPARRSVRP